MPTATKINRIKIVIGTPMRSRIEIIAICQGGKAGLKAVSHEGQSQR
jgi:hypothetical protein